MKTRSGGVSFSAMIRRRFLKSSRALFVTTHLRNSIFFLLTHHFVGCFKGTNRINGREKDEGDPHDLNSAFCCVMDTHLGTMTSSLTDGDDAHPLHDSVGIRTLCMIIHLIFILGV